jgi:hypothetical protein
MTGNNSNKPNNDAAARPTQTEIVGSHAPRGFGGFAERHYQELFEDDADYAPNYGPSGLGGRAYRRPPHFAGEYAEPQSYQDTVIFLHHNKQGIRLSIQATSKVFLLILVVVIVFLNSPGIGDIVGAVLKTVMNAR